MSEVSESQEPASKGRLRRARVLIVDDNPANLVTLRTLLGDLDLDLVEAMSGEEAIELVKADEFAVILLDVLMPGINGFETASAIRLENRSQHTPIVFLTAGDIDPSQMEEGYTLGAVDFVLKPIQPVALRAKVRGFVLLFQDKDQAKHEADQLRLLIDGTKEYAIFMLDPQGRVVTWNGGAERIKGYKSNQIIGQHFTKFYPQEAIDRGWPEHELKVAAAEGRFEDEGWRLRKDGSRFWANVVITALRDDRGQLLGFSKVSRDLTERKRAEESLRRSEERFRLLIESVQDYAIFLLDPKGNVVTWNAGAERFKGYKAEEIIGQHFSRFYPQEVIDRGWPEHELKAAAAEGRFEDEGWRLRKDGSRFWANVVITALRDEQSQLIGFSKVTRDLTTRKQAEESLRRSEERFRLLVEGAKDYAIFLLDPQGRVASWNTGAERIKQYTADEIIGQHFSKFYPHEAIDRGWPEHELKVATAEGRFEDEGWRVRKDGSQFWANVVITALCDAAGNFVGFSKITRDMTERKKAEENDRRLLEETTARRAAEDNARLVQEQRERLQVTLVSIGDAVISTDAQGRIDFVNPVAEKLIGWKSADAAGRTLDEVFNIVNEETRQPVDNPALKALQQGTVVGLANHTILISKDGTEWPIDDSAAPIRSGQGDILGSVLVFRDISERKRHEQNLQEQQEWLRVTLASIGDAVIATDNLGRVTLLNQTAEELTGWRSGEAQGQSLEVVFSIVNEQTGQRVENPVAKVLREGVIVGLANHTTLIAKDGRRRPIDDSAAPIRDAAGQMLGVVLIFRDVTEQRQAERELRSSEARKSAILETALDAIITMDQLGCVVEFNPAAERMFGYRRETLLGRELAGFIIPQSLREQHRRGLARYLSTGEAPVLGRRIELPALHADGSEFPVELAITRISTDGPPLFTAYLRNITATKRAEQHRNVRLAVSQILSQAAEVKTGVGGVLQAVCVNLGWDVGFLWIPNDERSELSCLAGWHSPDLEIAEFEEASCGWTFARGEGLPGRVWATGEQAWVLNLASDGNFPRAIPAAKHGLRSGFASPVIVGDRPLGVIEFFTRNLREPDAELSELIGSVAGSLGQFIERRRAEEELGASAERLRLALTAGRMGVWDWNVGTGEIKWSDSFESLHGLAAGTFGGTFEDFLHLIHPDDQEAVSSAIRRAIENENGFDIEFRNVWTDGCIHWIAGMGKVFPSEDGKVARIVGISMDVTQRKRAEQTAGFLADASAALAVLVDFDSTLQKVASLAVPSFADWATVDLVEGNDSLRRVAVAHADPAKVELAHELYRRFPPDSAAPRGAWNILRTGQPEIVQEISDELLAQSVKEDELLRITRELGLRSYIGMPLKVRGKTLGVITFIAAESGHRYDGADLATAQDLADRAAIAIENVQLYRELRDADRRKDEFLATLAHELRNPLAPIRNGLQVIRLAGAGGGMVEEARSMMERQLAQMVRLVDDLLDVSRITRNKLELRKERGTLTAVIQSAIETSRPLIEQAGHELSVMLPPDPVHLEADLTRLAQVFSNLLNNSAKYTEPGGRIGLEAEVIDGQVLVKIRDTGVGIPAEALPHLFQMFSQVDQNIERAQGGLGIGLTLVRRLVEMHGGTVEAHSAGPGRGSEFTVRLPALQILKIHDSGVSNDQPKPSHKRRILVVDDNIDSAISMRMMLELLGHETHTVHDGLIAVQAASEFRPDMILLDIGLPTLNGYDACRRIREEPWSRGIVIVALTGWGQDEDRRRSADAGFDHHLVKPVGLAMLEKVLGEP